LCITQGRRINKNVVFFLFILPAGEIRVATPTAIESVLPWKRGDEEDEENGAVKQNEFPSWASNKEYLAYNSPSATFLGNVIS
jgi:solute carrier family 9 (sodium/hydrogen exchanger), member 3